MTAVFSIHPDFRQNNPHFSSFCNLLNANTLRNRGIGLRLKMWHFNIIWGASAIDECHIYGQ